MWAAVGHILPIAAAGALSSVPIMAVILLLLSPNRSRSPVAFLIGWVLGLAVMITVFTLLAYVIPSSPRRSDAALGSALIAVGLSLIVIAIITWRRGVGTAGEDLPRWLRAVGSMRSWQALGFALLLNVRPKAVLLSAAAGLSLRGDSLSNGEVVVVIATYTVVSASSVAVPVVSSIVAPGRTERQLERARVWIAANTRIISALIMLMIGVVVVGNGLTRF